jgi:hypothetical protein
VPAVEMFASTPLHFSSVLLAASLVAGQQCDLQFDGRVPGALALAQFDANNNIFSPDNVFGQSKSRKTEDWPAPDSPDLKLSDAIELPQVTASLFDVDTVAVEVTIRSAPLAYLPVLATPPVTLVPAATTPSSPRAQITSRPDFAAQNSSRPATRAPILPLPVSRLSTSA